MPESRKRPGHHHPHQEPADIPASERTKGRILWAILLGIFGLIIAFFAAGDNWILLLIATAAGALIGYFIGRNMEKEAGKKSE